MRLVGVIIVYLVTLADVLKSSFSPNAIILDDILSKDYMPGTLLMLENPKEIVNNTNESTRVHHDGTLIKAISTMDYHRSMMNQYMCRNFLAEQIVSNMSILTRVKRKMGHVTSGIGESITAPSLDAKEKLIFDEGSSGYKDWLTKSTTLEDIYRHYDQAENKIDVVEENVEDFDDSFNIQDAHKQAEPKVPVNHRHEEVYYAGSPNYGSSNYGSSDYHFSSGGGGGSYPVHQPETPVHYEQPYHEPPTKYHVYNYYTKDKDLADLFEVALTALAFLAFKMFVVHVIMCIASVTNNTTTTTPAMAMSMSPTATGNDETGTMGPDTDNNAMTGGGTGTGGGDDTPTGAGMTSTGGGNTETGTGMDTDGDDNNGTGDGMDTDGDDNNGTGGGMDTDGDDNNGTGGGMDTDGDDNPGTGDAGEDNPGTGGGTDGGEDNPGTTGDDNNMTNTGSGMDEGNNDTGGGADTASGNDMDAGNTGEGATGMDPDGTASGNTDGNSPGVSGDDDMDATGSGSTAMDDARDKFQFRWKRAASNPDNQVLNELARRVLVTMETALIADNDDGVCLKKSVCDNNKWSRSLDSRHKIFIPLWSLGMSWLSGRIVKNVAPSTSMLDTLKASILGLGKANCEIIYQKCDLRKHVMERRRRKRRKRGDL
ncbi:unnamed protein product [Phyllotreta striolata]|uniref:Uncharacterized protein n=1 Tax=Phyllotreta striolata TaxID=444603 RepID=A0A9P0GU27_PHYSR|nr:unnamed protein product [Phyllotreta striolata]